MSARKTKKVPGDANALRMLETLTRKDSAMQEMLADERSNAALARQIYELRTARGLTQKQLADLIGTQQPVIARLEDADYQGHSLAMLHRIGTALGCRVAVGFVPRSAKKGRKTRRSHSFAFADAPGSSSVREQSTSLAEPGATTARPPQVVVIGGPNGAGKTSSAPRLLRDTVGIEAFVNADSIAEGLSGFAPQASALEAGRILLTRVRELAERRADFAFESTLSGRTLHAFLRRLTDGGYQAHIFYLWLPSADLAVARVRRRVQAGGHDVPEQVIRRRFGKSLANFYRLYRSVATAWRLYDGSVIGRQRLIAHGKRAEDPTTVDTRLWAAVLAQIEEASR